ncbi:MAG TPA: TetR/AcrR family transcriptional regulator [Chitinophagaceae bacterium]|jgi:AcrR family transcriptional regulator|nr:TetR/AcrR family transcriptional regulator [Chitinophagaceae bacterium]
MEVQERILLKSHELFMRYGLRSISLDEIASQLGISKKTIYQCYTDKDALVEAVVDIEILQNEKECASHRALCENPVHEIFLAMNMVHEMLKTLNPSILYDLEKYHPNAFIKFNKHKIDFFGKIVADNIQRGIEDGLYREDIHIDILTRYRIGSMFLIFNQEIFPANKTNIMDVLWQTTECFLHGLATPKGTKLIYKYKQQRLKKESV